MPDAMRIQIPRWIQLVGLPVLLLGVVAILLVLYQAGVFRPSVADHESCQRAYAVNDEGALLQCTWPHGGRPRYPFPYADECWTGAEYAVAGLGGAAEVARGGPSSLHSSRRRRAAGGA